MKDVVGVIYTARDEFSLRELASNRSVSALPVAAVPAFSSKGP